MKTDPQKILVLVILQLLLVFPVGAQEKKTDNVKKEEVFSKGSAKESDDRDAEDEVSLILEYFELDHAKANELLGKYSGSATNVDELRDILDGMIDAGEADLVETQWVRGRSGSRLKSLSVARSLYPTEYDPPEIPNTVGYGVYADGKPEKETARPHIHMTSAMPTAFETRQVGATLEADIVISPDASEISVNFAQELVKRVGEDYFTRKGREETAFGTEHINMPVFYTIKGALQILAKPGHHALVGIFTPEIDSNRRILVLLRADLISFDLDMQ